VRFLCQLLFVSLVCARPASAGELTLIGRTPFVESPRPGVRVNARSFYTSRDGVALKSFHDVQTRSDAADIAYERFSLDNGKTWSEPASITTQQKTDAGVKRNYPCTAIVDPTNNTLVEFWLSGLLPNDNPLEGMQHWTLRYRLSRDGGRTAFHEGPVVQAGGDFSEQHPFPELHIGKNSIMIGDKACAPIRLKSGTLLQPVQITPLGPNGKYFNPGGGYTYHDAAVLIGKWNEQGLIDWTMSQRIVADPARSTRGMLEPTVAEFSGDRILMVMRGSNQSKPHLPAHKWFSVSTDNAQTWSKPEPWTDTADVAFHSPSSCSQLLSHSNGTIYWIGNLSEANPNGNLPRYPLVIAEVDPVSLKLNRETLCEIDTRREGELAGTQISNFSAHEDRETGDILIHCSPINRTLAQDANGKPLRINWTSNAWLYQIRPSQTADNQ